MFIQKKTRRMITIFGGPSRMFFIFANKQEGKGLLFGEHEFCLGYSSSVKNAGSGA